jgi:fructose/tagatose bisphosphate aldolase
MPLATGLDILSAARAGKYGVGAFNTNDLEITQAILEACRGHARRCCWRSPRAP